MLLRNIPESDLAALDELAARLRVSRNQLLRRELHQAARRVAVSVTVDDLRGFSERASDLGDEDVARAVWS